MKILLLFLVLCLLGSGTPVHGGSYLIQLKNGRELLTRQYWESGNEVMFQIYGGIVGIPKDFIAHIGETASLSQETKTDGNPGFSATGQKPDVTQAVNSKPAEDPAKADDKPVDLSPYREKQQELLEQIDQARKKYLEALGSRDPALQEQARQEMVGLGKRFYDLADEVKGKNKGQLPDWWRNWER